MSEVKKLRGRPPGRGRKYELPNESKAVHQLQDRVRKLNMKLEQAQLSHRLDIAARVLPTLMSVSVGDSVDEKCHLALFYADTLIKLSVEGDINE